MNQDVGLMIHYEKYNQQVYIQTSSFILITNSGHTYMFWPTILAIYRKVLMMYYIEYQAVVLCSI